VKGGVTAGDKGGAPGQWSARKAQMAVQEYKRRGGGYEGGKRADNHLHQWTEEEWGTGSGARSRDNGERYLPREAHEHPFGGGISPHLGEEARGHAAWAAVFAPA
jgi:hypothetical protein